MKLDISKIAINNTVSITPDDVDDFYLLSNIIRPGDKITAQIRCKVKSQRKMVISTACVKIDTIDYQTGVDEMMLRGILTENLPEAKAGQHQRVLLSVGRPFDLYKDNWDNFSLSELQRATDTSSQATAVVIVMEPGLANLCAVRKKSTKTISTVEIPIPKARGRSAPKNIYDAFFKKVAETMVSNIDFAKVATIVIASPALTATQFIEYLSSNYASAVPQRKIVKASSNSGNASEVEKILLNPDVKKKIGILGSNEQSEAFEKFLSLMNAQPNKVSIGIESIAITYAAIETLLLTEEMMKGGDDEHRQKMVELKDFVEGNSGKVIIFPSNHKNLVSLGGIVATLRYPICSQVDEYDF